MITVAILTEVGKEYGYGHLMRCLAIAQGFRERGIDSIFYLRGDSSPAQILNEFIWYNIDWVNENVDISGKIVIVDSYHADETICLGIYKDSKRVLFIDDYNRISYPGGFVLNSVIGAEEIGYPANPEITYLLGPGYHPLRKEFWDVPDKIIRENIEKVLITFGGTDITNETPSVLRMLNNEYPHLEKHVIIGIGYSNVNEIKNISDEKTMLIFNPDAEIMKQEMIDCDIAISAAGQTIAELARIGMPTCCIKVAENQEKIIQNWVKIGFLTKSILLNDIVSLKVRKRLYDIGRSIIDGFGVKRCVEQLLND